MRVISAILIFLWCYLIVSLKYIFYSLKEKKVIKRKEEKSNLCMIKVQKSKLKKILDDDRRRQIHLRSNTDHCELIRHFTYTDSYIETSAKHFIILRGLKFK